MLVVHRPHLKQQWPGSYPLLWIWKESLVSLVPPNTSRKVWIPDQAEDCSWACNAPKSLAREPKNSDKEGEKVWSCSTLFPSSPPIDINEAATNLIPCFGQEHTQDWVLRKQKDTEPGRANFPSCSRSVPFTRLPEAAWAWRDSPSTQMGEAAASPGGAENPEFSKALKSLSSSLANRTHIPAWELRKLFQSVLSGLFEKGFCKHLNWVISEALLKTFNWLQCSRKYKKEDTLTIGPLPHLAPPSFRRIHFWETVA